MTPKLFQITPYAVTSGSMKSKYPVGSLIYTKSIQPEDVKVGDSITFYMPKSKIVATHEVFEIDREKKLFKTQGIDNLDENNNIIQDAQPVPFNNLIGIPTLCIPYLGFINLFITKSPGLYIVIGITLIIIIVSFLLDNLEKKE